MDKKLNKAAHQAALKKYMVTAVGFSPYRTGFKEGGEWQKQQGGIGWLKIEDGHKPRLIEGVGHSEEILIFLKGKPIEKATYHEAEVGFYQHRKGNWQPTHFAYINTPE